MTEYLKPKHSAETKAPKGTATSVEDTPRAGRGTVAHPEAFSFSPTDRMRRAKAALQSALAEGRMPRGAAGMADAQELARVCKTPSVLEWARMPGFMAYFTDVENFGSRLAYLQDLALEAAENILNSPDPKSDGAKAGLIKMLLGQDPVKQAKGEAMSMEELKALVLANRHVIEPLLQLTSVPAKVSTTKAED